ncbi:MAG: hypothetical protein ACYDG5_07735 [Dehalococcoidales bacterium]
MIGQIGRAQLNLDVKCDIKRGCICTQDDKGLLIMKHVVTSTEESERAQKAAIVLRTYSNYVTAWVVCFNNLYGIDGEGMLAFIEKIKQNANYQQIRGNTVVPTTLTNAYNRGRLTLKAIQSLPVDTNKDLASIGNLWLSVQSYYSIHGIGTATMIALRMSMPGHSTHRSYRAAFSQIMDAYLPKPFCAICFGGPSIGDYVFKNLNTSASSVRNLVQLYNPEAYGPIDDFIGKTLSTTRTYFLEERVIDKHKKKKRLTRAEKLQCCNNEHSTSLCDLLYRLRLHSNYDNPDMYIYADGGEAAKERYKNLQHLTELVIIGFETLMEKAIGTAQMDTLRDSFQ